MLKFNDDTVEVIFLISNPVVSEKTFEIAANQRTKT